MNPDDPISASVVLSALRAFLKLLIHSSFDPISLSSSIFEI
jgi:hypothetical protein